VDLEVEQRHHEVGRLAAGQALLGDSDVVPELALGAPFLERRGLGDAVPRGVRVLGAQVLDERGVDVQAADVVAGRPRP